MIREYRTEDRDALVQLFVETVHQVNARDYTPAQLDAWAPREQDLERWGRTFPASSNIHLPAGGPDRRVRHPGRRLF